MVVLSGVLVATAGLLVPPAAADGQTVSGNKNCSNLIPGATELRIENPSDGTYGNLNGFNVTIDVRTLAADTTDHDGDQSGSQVVDFIANGGVVNGVAVKGGPNTNFYDYRSSPRTSGTALHAPVNTTTQKFYGLSHISFCYVPIVPDVIRLKKVDQAGNPLAGATMQLWKETNNTAGLQTSGATPDTLRGTCSTTLPDGIGNCTFQLTESGTFYGRESAAPAGYSCCAPEQSTTVTSDATAQNILLTFTNSPASGSVAISKTDDAGNLLQGVTFELTGTSTLGTVYGAGDKTCTTDEFGQCTISGVELGTYDVDETNLDTTKYSPDGQLPKSVSITQDGQTVNLAFVNPRHFTKIVLVCFGDELYQSTVTENDGDANTTDETHESLSGAGLTDAQQAALCSTGGARFENNPAGEHRLDVDID